MNVDGYARSRALFTCFPLTDSSLSPFTGSRSELQQKERPSSQRLILHPKYVRAGNIRLVSTHAICCYKDEAVVRPCRD